MFCEQQEIQQKKKVNNNFAQRTFSKRSPTGKQNEIVVFFIGVPFQAHAGAWGEKKTKHEKEEEKGEKNTKQQKMKWDTKWNKGQKETEEEEEEEKEEEDIGESQKET